MATERPYVNGYESDSDGVERLVYRQMDDAEYADWQHQTASVETDAISEAWATIRDIRDHWLDICQIIFDEIGSPGSHDLPTAMTATIADNAQAWLDWRDAMRALPDQSPLDPLAAAAAAPSGSTSDTWGAPWPQPPTAPIRRIS